MIPPAAEPKRNTGRTGRRRLTEAETAQRGRLSTTDHRRLYGQPLPAHGGPLPPAPPAWFNAKQKAIWAHTLASAPPGLLRAADANNMMVLCVAVELYERLARQVAESSEVPAPELILHLRQVGTEVGRATRLLGLNAAERARIGLSAMIPAEQQTVERWGPLSGDGIKAAA